MRIRISPPCEVLAAAVKAAVPGAEVVKSGADVAIIVSLDERVGPEPTVYAYWEPPSSVGEVLRAGVVGLVSLRAPLRELRATINAAASGRGLDSASVVRAVNEAAEEARRLLAIYEQLTPTEVRVLKLLAEGLDNREIAARLNLSHGTVRNAVSRLMDKLGAKNRVEVAQRWWNRL